MPKFTPKHRTNKLRIKTEFVSSVLKKTAEEIRDAQSKVAEEWSLFEKGSGELKRWLQGHFSVADQEGGAKLSMRYLAYARFLDIPDPRRRVRRLKREGYHLYNRIVFGILYRDTQQTLRYGFTEEIQREIGAKLVEAVGGERNAAALISKSMRKGYQ
jgi:hypothetical protein